MKRFVLIALLLTAWVVPAAAQDQKIDHRLLVERDGRMYRKFSDTPFAGTTQEKNRIFRKYKNGLLHSQKLEFYRTVQLKNKTTWQSGKSDGPSTRLNKNGQVEFNGFFSDGDATGIWTLTYKNVNQGARTTYESDKKMVNTLNGTRVDKNNHKA